MTAPARLFACAALAMTAAVGLLARDEAQAQDAEAAARAALARPVTVGSVPFLLPHARYANVAKRLAGALRHERADVRAVAARTIFVLAGSFYADAVAEALAAETDPVAGAEMVRALLAIRGAAADADALGAARRLGVPALHAVSVTLAHTRPLDVLPRLADLDPDTHGLVDALLLASAADAGQVARTIEALPADTELAALDLLFSRADEVGVLLPVPIVQASLHRARSTRHAALIHLLEHPPAAGRVVVDALGAAAAFADDTGWTTVLVELIARGDPSVERLDLRRIVPTLSRDAAPRALWHAPALSRLTDDELAALRAHVFAGPDAGRIGSRPRDSRWAQAGLRRLSEPIVSGLDAAIAETAGCRPGRDEVAVLAVTYGDRGQARDVTFAAPPASPACGQAAALRAVLEIAPVGGVAPGGRTDHLVTVFTREALECARQASRPRTAGSGARLSAPRRVRDVQPVYPKHLIAARVQGTVLVEAVIDRSGCIASAVVAESVHPDLDTAALAAVAQWRFTPTLLNNEPVAVIMTTKVAFSLK